jgi:hypothetical protein
MKREPYRTFRIDREDVLLPLLNELRSLMHQRDFAGREQGYNSEHFNVACEAIRESLYNNQTTILEALRELKDATEPEVES